LLPSQSCHFIAANLTDATLIAATPPLPPHHCLSSLPSHRCHFIAATLTSATITPAISNSNSAVNSFRTFLTFPLVFLLSSKSRYSIACLLYVSDERGG
jgi:hypothetical protein